MFGCVLPTRLPDALNNGGNEKLPHFRRWNTKTIVFLNGQVHVLWNLKPPGQGGGVKEAWPACLQVTPLEARVPERGSLSFRVEVFPTKGNCYFAEEAEAFVSPANQMTFR